MTTRGGRSIGGARDLSTTVTSARARTEDPVPPSDVERVPDHVPRGDVQPKVILCDLGGVVIDIDEELILRAWAEHSDLDRDEVLRGAPDEVARDFERGTVSEADYITHVRRRFRLRGTDARIIEGLNALLLGANDDVVALLRELRDHGVPLFALTNTNVSHHREWRVRFADAVEPFERIHLSYEIGAVKPDAEAFRRVLDDHDLAAPQVVFIDDTPGHVRAARDLGLLGIVFTDVDALRSELRDLGLLPPT